MGHSFFRRLAGMLVALALPACGTPEQAPPPAVPPPPPASPPILSKAVLQQKAQNVALVPSPVEMQRALERAGIVRELGRLIPDRELRMDVPNKDQVAVRTGVILADMLLTVKTADKDRLAAMFGQVKQGLAQLGAGEDLPRTIDELVARIRNDAITRDELVKELDQLSGAVIPEIDYEAGERAVPLIQAGSWLEGANLLAAALREKGDYSAADSLLKQPAVVHYFLGYVRTEGQSKAPGEVIAQLQKTLQTLEEICGRPTLGEDEVVTIHSATTSVLDLL